MRPAWNNITLKHVPELRDLVHTSLSHNLSEGRHARIIALSPPGATLFSINVHRTEFIDIKDFAILPYTPLRVDNGTWRF